MATLDQFLKKALVDEPELDEAKKPKFKAYVKFTIHGEAFDLDDAMNKAERFIDDVESKFKPWKARGEVDGVDGV